MNYISVAILSLATLLTESQTPGPWNKKTCAVVLTYDDALNVHLDKVIPSLDSAGLKGTFYLSTGFPGFTGRVEDWKKAAVNGHELANHTMFHPCDGSQPGRSWVRPEYNLSTYTLRRIEDEIKMTNVLLKTLDGKTDRTFAYPCGDMTAGGQSYVDAIRDDFVSARGVKSEITSTMPADFFDIGAFGISGESGEQMIAIVKRAMNERGLAVFIFHGVGGEHNINVSAAEHSKLVRFLKENEKQIWVGTFLEVSEFLKGSR